jgi:hypothetical protein
MGRNGTKTIPERSAINHSSNKQENIALGMRGGNGNGTCCEWEISEGKHKPQCPGTRNVTVPWCSFFFFLLVFRLSFAHFQNPPASIREAQKRYEEVKITVAIDDDADKGCGEGCCRYTDGYAW